MKFKLRWQGILAFILIFIFVVAAIFAPLISAPDEQGSPAYKQVGPPLERMPHPPRPGAPLGTVPRQWDVFHSLIWGSRDALKFGLTTVLVSGLIGVILGSVSAYMGGTFNRIVMRITDGFLTFPLIAAVVAFNMIFAMLAQEVGVDLRMTVSGLFEQKEVLSSAIPTVLAQILFNFLIQLKPFLLAVVCFSWMPYARLINGEVLKLKSSEFITAARTLGASNTRLIFKHLLPNSISPVIIMAARDVGAFVALQATFVYIGLTGGSPWASLMVMGKNWVIGPGGSLVTYWWVFVPPTLALILFGIGWNLLGDELNYQLNPRKSDLF